MYANFSSNVLLSSVFVVLFFGFYFSCYVILCSGHDTRDLQIFILRSKTLLFFVLFSSFFQLENILCCGVSILGDAQKPSGQGVGQTAVCGPA